MNDKFQDLMVCNCSSVEHQLIFRGDEFEVGGVKYHWVFMHTHLSSFNFWRRLWYGLKYIFGYKCKYGHFDEVILTKDHVESFKNITKFLEESER